MYAERRRRLALCAFVAALLARVSAYAQAPSRSNAGAIGSTSAADNLRLELGEQRVISGDGVRSYSEGVPGVLDVRLTADGRQFVLVALRPGQTTLLLLMLDGSEKQYRISVVDAQATSEPPRSLEPPPGRVQARDNVRLDFYFVKLDKSYNHQLGVRWPGAYGGTLAAAYDLRAGALSSATAVVQDQPLPGLDLAQAAGWAKLQRHAALITANGEKARFSGGGEVNIPVQGSLATGVHRIEFGSTIGVLPRYDKDTGRLELEIEADVSDLSDDRGSGTPGRVTSTLSTLVNLELGQSLMLAGLSASSESRGGAGLPLLSQIPILGALFGTHRELTQDSEDVVFIVPSVLDAVALESRERIQQALDAYQRYDGSAADRGALWDSALPEPGSAPQRAPKSEAR
jgi:pilus assembly protein CpaC